MSSPVRLLLWAPRGAGQHYHGAGMAAQATFAGRPKNFVVTLAHGEPEQDPTLFPHNALVSPVSSSRMQQAIFLTRARHWINQHGGAFDVAYGISAYQYTLQPMALLSKFGTPTVIKITGLGADLSKANSAVARGSLRHKLLARQIRSISCFVATSEPIAKELSDIGVSAERIARIPNGVDTNRFRPAKPDERERDRELLGLDPLCPVVLFVGEIGQRKRPHLLIDACQELTRRGIPVHVLLVGPIADPIYWDRLQRTISSSSQLRTSVSYYGFQTDIAQIFRVADLFVLPSAREGQPNSLLEALATGLPSIVTAAPWSGLCTRNGSTPTVVEPNARAIASALEYYLRDPQAASAASDAAIRQVRLQFSLDVVVHRYERLFLQLMRG